VRTIINIDVPDLGPAIEFYRAALGVELKRIIDGDVAELSGASSTIYLLQKAEGSPPKKSAAEGRRYAPHWTPVHVDFVVDDVDAAAKRALSAGARQESGRVDWMGSKCITFSDPFGHGFCLIEFEGDGYT
jgi:predicted enzyme related to lactoylglutathione lyase